MVRGNTPHGSRSMVSVLAAVIGLTTCGCGSSLAGVPSVKLSELREVREAEFPLLVEVDKGDRVPLRFAIGGNLMQSSPDAPPMTLEAQRPFYLLLARDEPPRICFDGPELDCSSAKHGSLKLGFGAPPGKPPEVTVVLEQFVDE